MPLKCVGQFFLHPGPHPFKASSILKLHQPVQEDRQIRTMQPRTDSSKNTGRHKKGLKTTNKNATNIMLILNNGQNLMGAVLNCQTPRINWREFCDNDLSSQSSKLQFNAQPIEPSNKKIQNFQGIQPPNFQSWGSEFPTQAQNTVSCKNQTDWDMNSWPSNLQSNTRPLEPRRPLPSKWTFLL